MSSTTSKSTDPDPPPYYEQLATTVNTQINTDLGTPDRDKRYISNETSLLSHGRDGWLHYKMSPLSSFNSRFWMKYIRSTSFGELIQMHFGISRYRKDTDEPDCYFTCNLQPRTCTIGKNDIANLCSNIARLARIHRGSFPEYCECTFNDLRDGVRCDKGGHPNYEYYPPNSYWVKVTRNPIDNTATRIQLGISKHHQEKGFCDGPDAFFTCMLRPRSPKTSPKRIVNVLGRIVTASRCHHGHADEYCDCVLWDNNHKNTLHCSKKWNSIWPVRFAQWLEWMFVKLWIRQHDWLCCCACFESRV
jgi:hypothetical protein